MQAMHTPRSNAELTLRKQQKMHIWIDGQCLQTASNVRGIGRYVSELLRALHLRTDVQLTVSFNANLKHQAVAARTYLADTLPNIRIETWYGTASAGEIAHGYTPQRIADDRILAAHINAIAPDVALCPSSFEGFEDNSSPLVTLDDVECPTACIFHDAIPHRFPERYFHHPNIAPAYYRRFYSLPKYDFVLCNSDFTQDEYRELFDKDNCVTIGAGLPADFEDLLAADLTNVKLPKALTAYILYVGGLDWRKNVGMLVKALARIPDVQSGMMQFVLAGDHSEPELAPLRNLWAANGLPDDGLVVTGWVSDAQLVKLYRNASIAVQPSLMEGFGLAALEAMASGCPFIAARGGAVGEVVAREDLLFDGHTPDELAKLLSHILKDTSFRQDAVAFGKQRAKEFSWEKSAEITVSALRAMLEEKLVSAPSRAPAIEARPANAAPPRLIMDVTSTAQSTLLSGIQRVIHRLTTALVNSDTPPVSETILSYADDSSGWYRMKNLSNAAITRNPLDGLPYAADDSYFLIDSSWGYPEIQGSRLLNAMAMGQTVVHGIHDIGPLTKPGMTIESMPAVFRRWFEFILGHSTGIICVSRAVADEVYALLEAIELPRPMNVGYIRLGADFSAAPADPEWLDFLGDRPTFMMVGTIEPRKGHSIVLDAFERLWSRGVDVNLLLIGKPGWNTRILYERIKVHPEAERRLFLREEVRDGQLRAAYSAVNALIMASYLEGFGLPVVEAGHFGCPVILSDIPVFREVGQGAPVAQYFEMGNAGALAQVVEEMAGQDRLAYPQDGTAWPTWEGTAQEVRDIILGDNWYRRYRPRNLSPNAVPALIGNIRMRQPLDLPDRKHSFRYVEGPMVSDDGRRLQFIIALRNESSKLWSSNGLPGKGMEINIGSHIVAEDGAMLDYENPRTPIPFVLPPGDELYLPIYVNADWLARGARYVDVEVVQEAVDWFGTTFRLDLTQPPVSPGKDRDGSVADLRPMLLREPFSVPGQSGKFLLLGLMNATHHGIDMSDHASGDVLRIAMLDDASRSIGDCKIVSSFSRLDPAGYGLLTVQCPARAFVQADSLAILLGNQDQVEWRLKLVSGKISRISQAEPIPADQPA